MPPEPTCESDEAVTLSRSDLLAAAGLAAVAMLLYALTLAPGLLKADSGEMQTLAATLGYAHPTGFPVYLLLARLAALVPLGELPDRVNMLSGVMGALATGLVYLLGRLLTARRFVPAVGALALAVSPTFWSQAVIAEVYTTGIACMLGVLLGLLLWQQTGQVRWLFAAACLGGLSLGIHATHALLAPAALLLVLLTPRRWKANWAAAVTGALIGSAVTLAAFAIIDRARGPACYFRTVIAPSRSVWNLQEEDLDDFADRVRLSMSAPQFRGLLLSQPAHVTRQKTVDYTVNLAREFPPLWLVAAGLGVVWLGRRNAGFTLLLLLGYATHLAYDLQFDGVVHVMYTATYVPVALFGVAGLALVADALPALAARLGAKRRPTIVWDLATAMAAAVVVAWPMFFTAGWDTEGRRACWVPPEERDSVGLEYSAPFHHRTRQLIDDLEPNAVVITGWCLLYPYYYVAHVERGRTDMVFIQDLPQKGQTELADSLMEYIRRTAPRRPVYLSAVRERVAEEFELPWAIRGGQILYRVGKLLEKQ